MDPEVRPEVTTFSTMAKESSLGAQRFLTFSTWRALTRAVSTLIKKARSVADTHGGNTGDEDEQALTVIIKTAQ